MKNPIEAINELIKAINIAQSRGAYSVKEAHDAWQAIEFLNNAIVQNQQPHPESPATPEQPL